MGKYGDYGEKQNSIPFGCSRRFIVRDIFSDNKYSRTLVFRELKLIEIILASTNKVNHDSGNFPQSDRTLLVTKKMRTAPSHKIYFLFKSRVIYFR